MTNPLFIYSQYYKVSFNEHIFPVEKYGLVYQQLVDLGIVREGEALEPAEARREELLLAHNEDYLNDLLLLKRTSQTMWSEIPLNRQILDFFLLTTGGTILACERAVAEKTVAINLAGGYHHAFADRAEGFCYLNDIAVAVKDVHKRDDNLRTVIIDCDLHQGNGTARIFSDDGRVFTFSIHQEHLYPIPKERSRIDIGLEKGASGKNYLEKLRENLPQILGSFSPGLILYDAGADPFIGDQLGDLALTKEDLMERDLYVFGLAKERETPVAVVLGGGYAWKTSDVVEIHVNTCRAAVQTFR